MRRAELLEQLKERREERRKRRNRLLLMLLLLILILILLCLQDCNCEVAPEASDLPGPAAMLPTDPPTPAAPVEPLAGSLPRRNRPNYVVKPPEPATWLNAFRLQVGARAPRLATCFEGRANPGVLKWTTFVEPHEGRVSEHTLEAMLASTDLTRTEKDCVVAVLSSPPYDLPSAKERATPTRVGMVIEF